MTIDFIVPVRRVQMVERLLWSLSRNSKPPDLVSLVSNELDEKPLPTFGLAVRLVRFSSNEYPFGELDVALRRNVGIWSSDSTHIVTFDDDQLAPPNLVSSIEATFSERPFFWGHHRFIDFNAYSFDQILSLPPQAGRGREAPANAWHSWRSAYAGLFGARRDALLDIGGFDLMFAGRHGGEDQNLGKRLALKYDHSEAVFVHEPPFAWHPELSTKWGQTTISNQCSGAHDLQPGHFGNVSAQLCRNCPFYWVLDEEFSRSEASIRFDPSKVQINVERVPDSGPNSLFDKFCSSKRKLAAASAKQFLSKAYAEYTSSISPPDFAVSLETAAFLYSLCKRLAPRNILDLGSGFSSYALRSYAAERAGVNVFTVDDDPSWLQKTSNFLAACNLPQENLMTWEDFLRHSPQPADIVFHDLGSMSMRRASLPAALNHCRIGGIIILDDMHKEEYAPHAERLLITGKFHAVDMCEYSLDHFGRFCWMATKGG
jgi:predicted O-methyltransferase YrrM